jgi:uncharacterized membrane protein YidH (DUF202 family)
MKLEGEPTMAQIDDYNGNESPEKRKTVRLIIIGLLVLSMVYGLVKYNFSTADDYIGTPENPGISTTPR